MSPLVSDSMAVALIVAAALVLGLLQNSVSASPLPLTSQAAAPVAAITDPTRVQREVTNGAVLVDARSADEYANEHIAGAVSLPFSERTQREEQFVGSVPSSSRLIVYCDTACDASSRLATWLQAKGWADVAVFEDGMSAWKASGLPLASGANQ